MPMSSSSPHAPDLLYDLGKHKESIGKGSFGTEAGQPAEDKEDIQDDQSSDGSSDEGTDLLHALLDSLSLHDLRDPAIRTRITEKTGRQLRGDDYYRLYLRARLELDDIRDIAKEDVRYGLTTATWQSAEYYVHGDGSNARNVPEGDFTLQYCRAHLKDDISGCCIPGRACPWPHLCDEEVAEYRRAMQARGRLRRRMREQGKGKKPFRRYWCHFHLDGGCRHRDCFHPHFSEDVVLEIARALGIKRGTDYCHGIFSDAAL